VERAVWVGCVVLVLLVCVREVVVCLLCVTWERVLVDPVLCGRRTRVFLGVDVANSPAACFACAFSFTAPFRGVVFATCLQGEVVLALWAVILVNTVSLVVLVAVRAATAATFALFRWRYSPDPVGGLRCVLCRCCVVTSRRARGAAPTSASALVGGPGGSADPEGGVASGVVCGGRLAAITCCERL
jgi:hypothetical protein